MKTNPLAEDADALLALAESIATVTSEKYKELCISTESEALLRASIAAATFAIGLSACARQGPRQDFQAGGGYSD